MNTKGCKFVLGIILSHLLWISASAQVSFGHPEKINRQWKFTLSDPQEAKQLEYEDAHWQLRSPSLITDLGWCEMKFR